MIDLRDPNSLVDYAKSLDCVHCGLCLNTCPTYRLTGAEASSPRGRIHLMRSLAEGELEPDREYAHELDFCLLCRHCESVCPSGVRFGALMEHARSALEPTRERGPWSRMTRRVGFELLLTHRAALRAAATIARLGQTSGAARVVVRVLRAVGASEASVRTIADAPLVPSRAERARLASFSAARGERRGAVALLEGCVMPELFGRVNRATVEVLTAVGFDVHVPRDHVCCGSLHAHNGEAALARELACSTLTHFDHLRDEHGAPLPLVNNSAGCGAHLKELAQLFPDEPDARERAQALGRRTRDVSELLTEPATFERLRALLARSRAASELGRTTWDDPCHLCHGQNVRTPPRALLDLVPGLERVEMEGSESCCGSAGLYSLTRPADARAVLEPKLVALRHTRARTLVTANPGCQLQWSSGVARAGLDVRVLHLAEVLALALRG